MKLKKSDEPEMISPMPAVGGAAIPDRFRLDAVDAGSSGPSTVAASIAVIASLAAISMLGFVAWMLYQNWELIEKA